MCKAQGKKQPCVRVASAQWGRRGRLRQGLQLDTGPEVGTGVLGAGHFQTQMAAGLTHFPRGKTRSGGDAKTWQRWTKMKEWRSRDGERRAGLGESGVGDTVSHWVPGADEEASFRGERSEGLVESNGVGGAGGMWMGCSFRPSGSGPRDRPPKLDHQVLGQVCSPLPGPKMEWPGEVHFRSANA